MLLVLGRKQGLQDVSSELSDRGLHLGRMGSHQAGPESGTAPALQSVSSLVITPEGSDSLHILWGEAVVEPLVLGWI